MQVSCGFGHNLALDANGHVWAWGKNNLGQVGNGTQKDTYSPVMLEGLENIVQVTCGGKFCLALDQDGQLWGWGSNRDSVLGQAKTGSCVSSPIALTVAEGIVIRQIAAGSDCGFILDDQGVLWAWGRNDYFQLGCSDWKKSSSVELVRVSIPEENIIARVIGYNSHVMAITTEGNVYVWGSVSAGQLGTGKKYTRTTPILVWDQGNVIDGAVGSLICGLLTDDGTVDMAGYGKYYQMGSGKNSSSYTWYNPQELKLFTGTAE